MSDNIIQVNQEIIHTELKDDRANGLTITTSYSIIIS